MTRPIRIALSGHALLAPQDEIPLPLDEMIYLVTSQALQHAGLDISDVAGACMAASDLNDGRAISTMTLTGSTGSLRKSELRVCNDSLAAAQVAAAEVVAGDGRPVLVCSWSKLSDTDPSVIAPLAMEPVMYRGLGLHPGAVRGLAASRRSGAVTLTGPSAARPVDVAVAGVLSLPGDSRADIHLTGFGASMGVYLGARGASLEPLRAAAERAAAHAGTTLQEIDTVVVAGAHDVPDAELADVLAIPTDALSRQQPAVADLGYAAGLTTLVQTALGDRSGTTLIVSAAGLALENTHAIVMEKA